MPLDTRDNTVGSTANVIFVPVLSLSIQFNSI